MAKLTFLGGIHPYEGKELSKEKPIHNIIPKGEMVFPMIQHIGAPAIPIVKVKDYVKVGQIIAEAGSFVSAPIFSSISGTVKAIEPRRVVTGDSVLSIVITNDEQYTMEEFQPCADVLNVQKEEIIERIKSAGIVGMGGAGFPTFIKMMPPEPNDIEYVIVNAAECEPYLTSDYRRLIENPKKIINGLKLMLRIFDKAQGIIGIEDNKMDAYKILRRLTKNDNDIQIKKLNTKYPQGGERQLIYAVTGRVVDSSMLPADVGCVVNNVDTVVAIRNAVYEGKPLYERIVTITGNAIANPRNFRVPVGTSYAQLVEEAGGFIQEPAKIISGGPMMGFGIFDLNVPTTKTSSALLCLTHDDVSEMEPTACINCGKCLAVCPGKIAPYRLARYAEQNEEEKFVKENGMECCECGCCSYICPAKRPLTQNIKSMRKIQLQKRRK